MSRRVMSCHFIPSHVTLPVSLPFLIRSWVTRRTVPFWGLTVQAEESHRREEEETRARLDEDIKRWKGHILHVVRKEVEEKKMERIRAIRQEVRDNLRFSGYRSWSRWSSVD